MEEWIININRKPNEYEDPVDQSEAHRKQSIYKIPASMIDLNKRAYMTLSIGPYYYGTKHLKAMEEHKHRALLHFLRRSNYKSVQIFVEVLTPVVQDLKDAYDQLDPKWHTDTNKFLEVMILDGCFILEILCIATHRDPESDHAPNDPIFSHRGNIYIVPYLKRDMLMLENQFPMLVLEKLISVQNDDLLKKDYVLTKLILDFFRRVTTYRLNKCLHILDVYRKSLLLEQPSKRVHRRRRVVQVRDEIIRPATELIKAGIQIKRSKTKSLKDISFSISNGILRLPIVVIDNELEFLYLNLMAYERFHVGAGNEVTSYIFFMGSIINSARDVSVLHSCV